MSDEQLKILREFQSFMLIRYGTCCETVLDEFFKYVESGRDKKLLKPKTGETL